MSDIQQQVHDIRQRIAASIEAYPQLQPMLTALSCTYCDGECIDYTPTGFSPEGDVLEKCLRCDICTGTGTLNISDWPDGALSDVFAQWAEYMVANTEGTEADTYAGLCVAIAIAWGKPDVDPLALAALTRMLDELGVPA